MGLVHNQYPIVTNGLLTHFDPANGSSFVSNKKNLLYLNETNPLNFLFTSGRGSYDTSNSAILWENLGLFESWGAYVHNWSIFNYSLDITKQYTASFEWKMEGHQPSVFSWEIVEMAGTQGAASASLLNNSTLQSNGWYKFVYTFTPANSGRSAYFRVITGSASRPSFKFWWRNLQLEEGGTATSYVSGILPTILYDISGNNLHGTIVNPIYDSLNGGSLYMNGSSTYIDTNNKYLRNYNNGTIDIWAKTRDISATQHFYYEGSGGDGFGGEIEFHMSFSSNAASVYIPYGGITSTGLMAAQNNYGSASVSNNTWFNVVLAYSFASDNSSISFTTYHNSVITGSTSLPNPPRTSLTGGNSLLGKPEGYGLNPPRSFQGSIGTFKFYNRSLSQTEVLQNFNALRGRYGI